MYFLICGGGKVGANLARLLLRANHEVTLIEQQADGSWLSRRRFALG